MITHQRQPLPKQHSPFFLFRHSFTNKTERERNIDYIHIKNFLCFFLSFALSLLIQKPRTPDETSQNMTKTAPRILIFFIPKAKSKKKKKKEKRKKKEKTNTSIHEFCIFFLSKLINIR